MLLSGDEYSERLESFSHFTLVLMSGADSLSREIVCKASNIVSDSELTEEQVIKMLLELLETDFQQLPPVSFEDALEIVCDALEEGYFYSLYKILDKNAELVLVDDARSIVGIRNVINFLVQERLAHLYCSDNKTITCDILKVDKGERYGVGEKCILLLYHLHNDKKEHYVIKVHFEKSVINKLEVFRPYGPLKLVAER